MVIFARSRCANANLHIELIRYADAAAYLLYLVLEENTSSMFVMCTAFV